MAGVIYSLCALAAGSCSFLLLRAYLHRRSRLLLWSGLCFAGLTLNNILLVFDKVVFPDVEMSLVRTGAALLAMMVLLYGLVWERE